MCRIFFETGFDDNVSEQEDVGYVLKEGKPEDL